MNYTHSLSAINVAQQSLSTAAPEAAQQFKHNLSLVSSKSEKQRRDALAYLTSQLSSEPPVNPVGTKTILTKVLPLISDNTGMVRTQLIKLLRSLQPKDVKPNVEQASMFVRAGLTNLSNDINNDSLIVVEWLLDVADTELVACGGGWVKTLRCFCALMGWSLAANKEGWSSGSRDRMKTKDTQAYARQMSVLSRLLRAGFKPEPTIPYTTQDYWDNLYRIPRDPHSFDHLNLFGEQKDEDGRAYLYLEDRQKVFHRRFLDSVSKGIDRAKKEGGTTGRAATVLDKVLKEGMDQFDPESVIDDQDLLDLW